jgi:murein L,D-transpeptidase YcbB/YkuD
MMSSHLYHGKVNAESLTAEWGIRRDKPEVALDQKLELFIQRQSPFTFMKIFYPDHRGYEMMIAEAKALQNKLQGDYKTKISLPKDKLSIDIWLDSIHHNSINKKLQFLGYSHQDTIDFSDSLLGLHKAVKLLQKAHGLNADGKLGRNTLLALDQSIEDKINALYVNMERLRWLPDSLNKRHILVNIADFTLDFVNNQDTLIQMRTVVGKDFRQTPVFNARLTYLVLSPTWTVPPGILRNDVIPAVAKNINYLASKNMRVLDASGNSVDPTTINWRKVNAGGKFPYRVRQDPGAQNALGRVKFMFPNKYSVYLHDTPSKELFARDKRIFSSGCIRIEKPFELAQLLLADDSVRWNDNAIKEAMESGKETTVLLKNPVNVYIYYLTAWSNGKEMSYRQDIYGRDKEILEALKERR